jgi:peptide/nickel transport system ATP-binding protein
MSQRALIALSLVLDPEVLVMDEPTAALDLLMQRSILTLLQDLQEEYDLTVAFITHDLPLVAGLSDRIAVMYAFEFVEVAPADEILSNPSHPYTRALLRAVPKLDMAFSEMDPIEGSAPDPVNIPQGCSYHPRCPLADDGCVELDPGFQTVGSDHRSACHHWEDAADAIPLSADTDPTGATPVEGKQSDEPVTSLRELDVHFESEQSGLFNLFEDPDIVRAVDGVDLELYENDVVTLVGESGCGKTTLGRTAIGAQKPTAGSVEYRGQDIWEAKAGDGDVPFDEIRRSLQMIHQDPGSSLNPNRRVEQTLAVPLKQWHPDLDENDRRERILGMLEYVGMTPPEDYAGRFPHQLSGGEKQRVALIRALMMNPDVILADEAVSALDVSLRVEMMDLMLDLQAEFDTSFIFISHNLTNARYLSGNVGGRIAVMYLGEIVEIGPAEAVIHDPKHPYTKVLRWATADIEVTDHAEEPPMRGIDIPDPIDPPSGCHFHTRCPAAREICTEQAPELDEEGHCAACFREDESHEYWDSEPLPGAEANPDI